MRASRRLEAIPPYLFAELERKIAAKRAAGIDVISLGIGDPDTPTYAPIVAAAQRAVADPSTHTYPSNRGRHEFREAIAAFYARRFGVELDPETEVMAAIGAKECIFNLNLAFLDPGTCALASDPGYPVYSGGPLIAGADYVPMPLLPERQFAPDLSAISAEDAARARLDLPEDVVVVADAPRSVEPKAAARGLRQIEALEDLRRAGLRRLSRAAREGERKRDRRAKYEGSGAAQKQARAGPSSRRKPRFVRFSRFGRRSRFQ